MCVKLSSGDLNPDPCPPHLTNTYICGVITTPRVRSGNNILKIIKNVANKTIKYTISGMLTRQNLDH